MDGWTDGRTDDVTQTQQGPGVRAAGPVSICPPDPIQTTWRAGHGLAVRRERAVLILRDWGRPGCMLCCLHDKLLMRAGLLSG